MAALCFYVFFILKLSLVAGQSVQYVLKGREATLSPSLGSAPDDILWKHNGNKVITFDSTEETVFPPFEGRITLAWGTAELTIDDVGFEDSGEYELDALIRNKLHRSQYMLKVLDKISKPVIQCEMNEDSGNATSGQRATLHCSSDSDTPEALTFKWNLEEKSHLGQALTIALGDEHDHMEYSCTAAHSLHAMTSVFMAKDCYKEGGPEALEIIVPIVIASLILLSFCILTFIFRHQIKRACLRQRKSDDVEKQTARTDSKGKEESDPLMSDIHRQETFASKQRLIQQSDFEKETPQKQETTRELQEIRSSSKKVKDRAKMFENPEQTESQADTQTEEENDTEIVENASNQPASPIINGLLDSERERDLTQNDLRNVRKSEEASDSDSHYHDAVEETVQNSEPVERMDEEKSSVVEEDQPLESKDESQDKAENATAPSAAQPSDESRALPDFNSDNEDKTKTDVTGDSSSVHSDQEKDQKQSELISQSHLQHTVPQEDETLAESSEQSRSESAMVRDAQEDIEAVSSESPTQVSLLHPSDKAATEENSQTEVAEPESSSQINSDGESTPGPEVEDGQRDASHNVDLTPNESQMSSSQPEPSESESERAKHKDEESSAVEQTNVDPVNEDQQGDLNHDSQDTKAENATASANAPPALPETTGENEENNSDVKEQKTAPTKEDPQGNSNSEGQVNENENTNPETPESVPQSPPKSSLPTDENSDSRTNETEVDKKDELETQKEAQPDRGSQSDPNQSPDPKVEVAKGPEKSGSSTDEEQHDQDSNDNPEGSTQTGTAEITPAAGPGSEGEADESAHPTATALSQSTHNKESKDTDAANASSAQVSEETKDNTDKESDSSGSEQIDEAAEFREGQQQS